MKLFYNATRTEATVWLFRHRSGQDFALAAEIPGEKDRTATARIIRLLRNAIRRDVQAYELQT